MFGLFQAEMPFGRRLWLMFLVVIAVGVLKPALLPTFQSDPIQFATDLLLLFGAVFLVSVVLVLIFVFTRTLLVAPLFLAARRVSEETVFWRYAETKGTRTIEKLVYGGSFVVAVLIWLPNTATPVFRWAGFAGLCFIASISVFSANDDPPQQDVICTEFDKSWTSIILFRKAFSTRRILFQGGFSAQDMARLLTSGWGYYPYRQLVIRRGCRAG